jgi:hypothetical protein
MPGKRRSDVETGRDQMRPLDGYPSLADFIASDPDRTSLVFRRFDRLAARNILYLQSELADLETKLVRNHSGRLSKQRADGKIRRNLMPKMEAQNTEMLIHKNARRAGSCSRRLQRIRTMCDKRVVWSLCLRSGTN